MLWLLLGPVVNLPFTGVDFSARVVIVPLANCNMNKILEYERADGPILREDGLVSRRNESSPNTHFSHWVTVATRYI